MQSQNNPNQLLTLEQLAAEFGFARSTVYRLMSSGELPRMMKIGKQRFVRRSTLEKFLRERESEAALAA